MSEQHTNDEIKLPSEVLAYLFSFLSAIDRRSVRLTCSDWYDACNDKRILQNEKLVIRTNTVHHKYVTDTLMKCQYKYMNLEFHAITFDNDSRKFWEQCGPRVHCLSFSCCVIGEETVEKILSSCEHMKYLSMDRCLDMHYVLEHVLSSSDLSGFTRNSLIGLELKFIGVNDCTFSKIYDIFPNIKELSLESVNINCYKRVAERYYGKDTLENRSNFDSKYIFSFSCIFHKLKLNASVVEKLALNDIGDRGLLDEWLEAIGSLPNLRLKELTMTYHSILSENAFIQFFSKQTHLVSLSIIRCLNFTEKCILHVLANCPTLEHLIIELDPYREYIFDQALYDAILTSRLVKFELTCSVWDTISFCDVFADNDVNTSLRYWNSPVPALDSFCPSVIEAFCNLTSLELVSSETRGGGITDDGLQSICCKLINLTRLAIQTNSSISDYGFTGRRFPGYSIKRLRKLESLSITVQVECDLTEVTYSEFILPCLRRLNFSIQDEIPELSLFSLARGTPLLTHALISSPNISYGTVTKVLESWSNLVSLHISDPTVMKSGVKKPSVGYEDLMKSTKYMRFVKVNRQVFWYNIFKKQWEEYVRRRQNGVTKFVFTECSKLSKSSRKND